MHRINTFKTTKLHHKRTSNTIHKQNILVILLHDAEALVAATKEIGLEVNAHKAKYMTVSQDQNTGRIHSMKVDNSSIERVEEFKYLGTTVTNQNSIQEEIKSRLKSGECLLLFGAESSVIQVGVQKFKDQDI